MDDLISRQAAIDALAELARDSFTIKDTFQIYLDALKDADLKIRQMPTAEPSATLMKVEVGVDKESLRKAMEEAELTLLPAEKKRRWVYDEERGATGIYAICTACNEMIYQTGEFNYCPNCGAKMEESNE